MGGLPSRQRGPQGYSRAVPGAYTTARLGRPVNSEDQLLKSP